MKLTRAQAQKIDRDCVDIYSMPTIVLMENAARAVADVAIEMLGQRRRVLIVCGGGNNGGDGLAAARHLHNRGCEVTIGLTVDPDQYEGDAKINWDIISAMKLPTIPITAAAIDRAESDLLIDAIFGTGLIQPPRESFKPIAEAINRAPIAVLSVDVPSGLDCDTGRTLGPCVIAATTITFVAEKIGFEHAAEWVGYVRIGDIGCPRELLQSVI